MQKGKHLRTVRLTEDDKKWLMTVYGLKRKNILRSGIGNAILTAAFYFIPFWFVFCYVHDFFFDRWAVWLTPD